jgi:hypothetical protein
MSTFVVPIGLLVLKGVCSVASDESLGFPAGIEAGTPELTVASVGVTALRGDNTVEARDRVPVLPVKTIGVTSPTTEEPLDGPDKEERTEA